MSKNIDNTKLTTIYNSLLSSDLEVVNNQLVNITEKDINNHSLAYLVVLSRFHWDTKIRRESKKILKLYTSPELWEIFEKSWKDKYRNIQGYSDIKQYFLHNLFDIGEYFLFASQNRRIFFDNKPMKGMFNIHSALSTNKDEIQNVFECIGEYVTKIPERITQEETIRVAKFLRTPNIDMDETITKLSKLPNLRNLIIWSHDFKSLPLSLNNLNNLERLGLNRNNLNRINKEIFLPKLKFLDVYGNDIDEVNFDSFPNLEFLSVHSHHNIKFKNIKKEVTIGCGDKIYNILKP